MQFASARRASPGPLEAYNRDLESGLIQPDAAQRQLVEHLEKIHNRLIASGRRWRFWRSAPVRGLYIHGDVGRGKTYLMDLFFQALPFDDKVRLHFHRFMQRLHTELGEFAGREDPLEAVAARLAGQARVLCFDEFFVKDIADAMLLGRIMDKLFNRGLTLVTTSNIAPRNLYADGLQRDRFLPAIKAIEAHCDVLELTAAVDYRLRALTSIPLFHYPLDTSTREHLERSFASLAGDGDEVRDAPLKILGRKLAPRAWTPGVVWFDFSELCGGPRSQMDYIELAREFHSCVLSGVPVFSARSDDEARRFIALVDEFYERKVNLVLSAAAPLGELYQGSRLAFEFRRTRSRLREMQTREYLTTPHRH